MVDTWAPGKSVALSATNEEANNQENVLFKGLLPSLKKLFYKPWVSYPHLKYCYVLLLAALYCDRDRPMV